MVEAHATLDSIVAAHAISLARARPASLRQLLFGRERRAARLMVLLAVCNQANGVSTLTVYLSTVLARQLGVEGTSAGGATHAHVRACNTGTVLRAAARRATGHA